MAFGIRTSRHRRASRPPKPTWMRRRVPEHDTLLAAFMVALVIASVAILVRSAPGGERTVSRSLVPTLWQSVPTRPGEGAAPPAPPASAVAPHAPIDEVASTESGPSVPRPLVVGGRARVVKTDGLGLILHAAPRAGARTPAGLPEGTAVTIQELASEDWARVQSETRQGGWVPTAFLAPTD